MEFLSLLALVSTLFIIFYKSTTRIKKTTSHPLPPGPAGYPIVGCLLEMVKNKPTFRWIHNHMRRLDTEIACFRIGSVHVITVSSPELVRQIFKEQDDIFATRPDSMSARLTSNGYLSTALSHTGDQWKKMRRVIVLEVVTPSMYQWLHAKRCEEADHLVRYVYNQCQNPSKNGVVDVREAAKLYCGSTIRKMVFGKRFFGSGMEDGGPGIEEREHMDALFIILQYVYGFAIAQYIPLLEMCDLDGHKKILSDALDCLRKYQDPEVDNRAKMWRNGSRNTNEDILDVLIGLKDSNDDPLLSTQEIKAQLIEIFIALIDNPSNVVEWAMSEMINEPRFLDLAYKELDGVVGKNNLVQESDLAQLNYIKACVKEALRLHPVAPFNLPHVSTADTIVGGYFIPKGSHLLISRRGLGWNPRVWKDPLKFKPERHIVDESSQVVFTDPELRMWSFSLGKRGCPAVTLGSNLMTLLLARLVQGFSWRLPSNVPVIELVESHQSMLLAKPLIAHATPRLEPQVYHQI
ncbi:hypothetical protein C2S51_013885 [Perilla frutescens var. frutescens]|nr:hypothetical protein C2S51_013885 [Perilla frutescens var. frutescens]